VDASFLCTRGGGVEIGVLHHSTFDAGLDKSRAPHDLAGEVNYGHIGGAAISTMILRMIGRPILVKAPGQDVAKVSIVASIASRPGTTGAIRAS
jgi:hypothetical protein